MAPAPGPPHAPRSSVLQWHGRWGRWDDSSVHVLAACVGELEVLPDGDDAGLAQRAVQELSEGVRRELPQGAACVNLHWTGRPASGRHRMRVALVCEPSTCTRLQQSWQRRQLCEGRVTATWLSCKDTGSVAHGNCVESALAQRTRSETGLLLQLPSRWVVPKLEVQKDRRAAPLSAGSHWFDFAALFGKVLQAEMLAAHDPSVIDLLVRFAASESARAMFKALTERYLYNPQNRCVDDTHPVTCALGRHEQLRSGRWPARQGAPAEAGFVLRRVGAAASEAAGPRTIRVLPARPHLVVGREGCDVLLRRQHVSKAHASLELRRDTSSQGWVLLLKDTSANGTWLNGQRLVAGWSVELCPGDRVSFLPASHALYPDALLYEVAAAAPRTAAEPHASPASGGTNGALEKSTGRPAAKRPRAAEADGERQGSNGKARKAERPDAAAAPVAAGEAPRSGKPGPDGQGPAQAEQPPGAQGGRGAEARGAGRKRKKRHKEDAGTPASEPAGGDVREWVLSLDGGGLAKYAPMLQSLFDDVSQIRQLYAHRLQDFFEDVGVQDLEHRAAFTGALRALRQQSSAAAA